jgi:hypothetical protein
MVENINRIHLCFLLDVAPFLTMITVPLYLKNQRKRAPMQGIPLETTHTEGKDHHRGE